MRAQVCLEFLVSLAVVLGLVALLASVMTDELSELRRESAELELRVLADSLATEYNYLFFDPEYSYESQGHVFRDGAVFLSRAGLEASARVFMEGVAEVGS